MRAKLYYLLVNKVDGITYRYHKKHDNSSGMKKLLSYLYLIWLNICYYCFFCKYLRRRPEVEYYEVKQLNIKNSESRLYHEDNPELTVDEYVKRLAEYDIISFDVFDTLIFRPFSLPTDVFYLIGEKMDILDFKNIRAWAEWDARVKCHERHGHMEVTLKEIWENLADDVGCDAELGMWIEIETELKLCYANPFMLQVWKRLTELGKRIIILSDMYLPAECLVRMLEKEEYIGAERVYVSCEYGKNKASGSLYRMVNKELHKESAKLSIVHVGDNPHSDNIMAKQNGWDTFSYPNVNKNVIINRPFDMSFIVGSAYRALISNHLYNGLADYNMEYEYGYIYGGLFVTGYCQFVHEYCQTHDIDHVLFLSRDGDILKQVYDKIYPEDRTSYVYWSRKAAAISMSDENKHDYFRRFIYHKLNQKYTIKDILHSMELDFLTNKLGKWKEIWTAQTKKQQENSMLLAQEQVQKDLDTRAKLLLGIDENNIGKKKKKTNVKAEALEQLKKDIALLKEQQSKYKLSSEYVKREDIPEIDSVKQLYFFGDLQSFDLLKEYYHLKISETQYHFSQKVLNQIRKDTFVDLKKEDELTDRNGYLLRRFIEANWDQVQSHYHNRMQATRLYYQEILAGSRHAVAVDIGWAGSGAQSLSHLVERIWKLPCTVTGIIAGTNTVYNSEPDASESFLQSGKLVSYMYSHSHNRDLLKKHDPNKDYNIFWELLLSSPTPKFDGFDLDKYGKVTLRFGKYDENLSGIRDIQQGILDFAEQYVEHFKQFPYMLNISGRDAYAPMLLASSHHEKYLKTIEKKFNLEINVN